MGDLDLIHVWNRPEVRLLLGAVVVLLLLPVVVVLRKGRRVGKGEVFRASRMSAGNRLFPTQVAISPQSVVHYTPQWIGKHEHSIHMAHVSSVSIDTGLLFSDVIIETSGGSGSIRCRGHRKGDAVRMKQLIEEHQTAYYRGPSPTHPPPSESRS